MGRSALNIVDDPTDKSQMKMKRSLNKLADLLDRKRSIRSSDDEINKATHQFLI